MGLKWDCPAERTCAAWALSYFLDCVCNRADKISFFLGITSIVCWGVAELPHIVLSLQSSGAESISLAFIFTWMIGDIFNLAGCWISPGTLPTQFYLAVLYSVTTFLLVVLQVWSAWVSYRDSPKLPASRPLLGTGGSGGAPRWHNDLDGLFPSDPTLALTPSTQSLPVLRKPEGMPPLPLTVSLPACPPYNPSRNDLVHISPGLNSGSWSWRRLTASSSYGASGSPAARGLIFSSLVVIGVTLNSFSPAGGGEGRIQQSALSSLDSGRRQLSQDESGKDLAQSLGLILGYLMACIYLTGRLPQVFLNWSHDFVIGASTSTIVFTFLGNATYLGSILVRGVEWTRLKPVLPWAIDVTCCLLMDIFMISRYLILQYKEGYTALE